MGAPRTIVFAMLADTGHYTGTFRLARCLRAQAFRIVYVGMADFADLVRAQGFEFLPFAQDLVPAGYVTAFAASSRNRPQGLLPRRRQRRTNEALFAAYVRRIEDGSLDQLLRSCRTDLLICDTFLWHVALRALGAGIPTIGLSVTLTYRRNGRIPPIVTGLRPGPEWWSPLVIRGTWSWLRLKFFFTKRVASRLLGLYRFPHRMHHLVGVFLRIARRSGYPAKEGRTWWFGEIGPRLALPEIVLGPEAFQFPGAPKEGKLYLGDFIDTERCEEPLDEDPGEDRPLVYCSLGTGAPFYPHAGRFFRAVVAASRLRPDWRFTLHVGSGTDIAALGPAPPNLRIRERVPQLALLRRAAVMVNHGGFQSVMECIHFGVPMVICPGLRDQPGIAARAAYHGIAYTTSMAGITPESLVGLVERAMRDGALRDAIARLQRAIASEAGMEAALRFVGAMLQEGRIRPASSVRPAPGEC